MSVQLQKLLDPRDPEDLKIFADKIYLAIQELRQRIEALEESMIVMSELSGMSASVKKKPQ